jgi:iron complex transport system substrate-binding protein
MTDILTTGRGTFLDRMIELAGGENIFADLDARYPQVSAESVIAGRPEVIVELMPGVDATDAFLAEIQRQWRSLGPTPAMEHHRVHVITDDHGLIPSLRYVEIVEKVADLLHPERSGGE